MWNCLKKYFGGITQPIIKTYWNYRVVHVVVDRILLKERERRVGYKCLESILWWK